MSKDGDVLRCHKARLTQCSEYFQAMLSHEVRETCNNKMDVPEYGGVTVAAFLEWIYAPKVEEEQEGSAQTGEFIPEKEFDVEKLSPGIFMAHFQRLSVRFRGIGSPPLSSFFAQ